MKEEQKERMKQKFADAGKRAALNKHNEIKSVCDIHKGTRCEKSFPSYTDGKCRECGGQAN